MCVCVAAMLLLTIVLSPCSSCSVLDLSFNNIKHVPGCIALLENLRVVYFVQNKIAHINGFGPSSQSLLNNSLPKEL